MANRTSSSTSRRLAESGLLVRAQISDRARILRGFWICSSDRNSPVPEPPSVSANADGRLEVFATDWNKRVIHAWQTIPGGLWSGIGDLGGDPVSATAVGRNADGRLEVFARSRQGSTLWHRWQHSAGGSWIPSGERWADAFIVSAPTVASGDDGRLHAVALGSDGAIWHREQCLSGCSWTPWTEMAGALFASRPALIQRKTGRLAVVAVGRDGVLYMDRDCATCDGGIAWGVVAQGPYQGRSSAVQRADGTVDLFVREAGGWLDRIVLDDSGGAASVTRLPDDKGLSTVAAAETHDGAVALFELGYDDGQLWTARLQRDGSCSPWRSLDGNGIASEPAVIANADGRLAVFAMNTSGTLVATWEAAPGGAWSQVMPVAGSTGFGASASDQSDHSSPGPF
jgi:hypothetical protein